MTDHYDGTCSSTGARDWVGVWVSDGDQLITASTVSTTTDFDTKLYVVAESCPAGTELGCNDDTVGVQSEVEFTAVDGAAYYIFVEGFLGATGNFEITLTRTSE